MAKSNALARPETEPAARAGAPSAHPPRLRARRLMRGAPIREPDPSRVTVHHPDRQPQEACSGPGVRLLSVV